MEYDELCEYIEEPYRSQATTRGGFIDWATSRRKP